jgi:hypothetical protein
MLFNYLQKLYSDSNRKDMTLCLDYFDYLSIYFNVVLYILVPLIVSSSSSCSCLHHAQFSLTFRGLELGLLAHRRGSNMKYEWPDPKVRRWWIDHTECLMLLRPRCVTDVVQLNNCLTEWMKNIKFWSLAYNTWWTQSYCSKVLEETNLVPSLI